MKPEHFNIKVMPLARTLGAFDGEILAQALIRNGIFIRSDCGGKGTCQKCQVKTKTKTGCFEQSQLACQMAINQDITIQIPAASLASPNIITKPPVQIPEEYLPADKGAPLKDDVYAIAIDLGTTTVAIYLVGLTSEKLLSSLSVKNPQSFFGDDVMTRITRIAEDKTVLLKMQTMVVKAIEWGITSILKTCGIPDIHVESILVVGNSTMTHILAQEDPSSIGVYPYHPGFTKKRTFKAKRLGFSFDHDKKLTTMPLISGFLGSDIVSAAIAADLENQPVGTLLIDIGTNGEIMLKGTNKIYAASCATGPAFEGACTSSGMPAIPGALCKVIISDKTLTPSWQMIKNGADELEKPSGICGSGIVSAVCELLKKGIIHHNGRFNLNSCAPNLVKENPARFFLVKPDMTENNMAIKITQKDIRSIQLAKGALFSGLTILCREAGLKRPDKILIAGAFGSFIDIDDMITIGLLPKMDKKKIRIIGNAAGAGAILTLFNANGTQKAEQLIQKTKVIDLSTNPSFQDAFVSSLNFF